MLIRADLRLHKHLITRHTHTRSAQHAKSFYVSRHNENRYIANMTQSFEQRVPCEVFRARSRFVFTRLVFFIYIRIIIYAYYCCVCCSALVYNTVTRRKPMKCQSCEVVEGAIVFCVSHVNQISMVGSRVVDMSETTENLRLLMFPNGYC